MRLIAHRGASGHAPENTLAAVRLALEMGAKAVEIDVHQTKDHKLVVLHDDDLRRVGRRRATVRGLSFKELSAVDVGSWFDPRFSGERIPRLEDVMRLVAGRAEFHLEIKAGSRRYPGIERRVVEAVRAARAEAWTVISSFDDRALRAVRALDPGLRLGYLMSLVPLRNALRKSAELGAESLHVSLRRIGPKQVRLAHARGLKVFVYTVNTPGDVLRLKKMGVDAVFSNFPELSRTAQNR